MKKYSVLIAEDSPDWQDLISQAVKSAVDGHAEASITIISDYLTANEALDKHWDLLITDLGFGNSTQSLMVMGKHLIEKANNSRIPVIAISGTPATPQVVRDILIECKAVDFFSKANFLSKAFALKIRSVLNIDKVSSYRQSSIRYDVFLCYHPLDQTSVRQLSDSLRDRGIISWFDQDHIYLDISWQKQLELDRIRIKSVALIVGSSGRLLWQDINLRILINTFVLGNYPVIPVLLENARSKPDLPLELMRNDWIDMRAGGLESLDCLVSVIQEYRQEYSSGLLGSSSLLYTSHRTIRIFLASSSELLEDRNSFDLHFRQANDRLLKRGVYLEVIRWENFLDAMSKTRLQDEYNKAVCSCDILVGLFKTKTGQYSKEEFEVAHKSFKTTGKPIIYTYFRRSEVPNDRCLRKDLNSLWDFQEKLSDLGHYYTEYNNMQDLLLQFGRQLDQLIDDNRI